MLRWLQLRSWRHTFVRDEVFRARGGDEFRCFSDVRNIASLVELTTRALPLRNQIKKSCDDDPSNTMVPEPPGIISCFEFVSTASHHCWRSLVIGRRPQWRRCRTNRAVAGAIDCAIGIS